MFSNGSKGTLNFQLFGIPIQIQPFFWLVAVFFSPFVTVRSDVEDPRLLLFGLLAWTAAWLLSFIVHEMGHALTISRLYGAKPRIVLYGFGGVTLWNPYYTRFPGNGGNMLVAFAGPGAELLTALLLAGLLALCGVSVEFGLDAFGPIPIPAIHADITGALRASSLSAAFAAVTLDIFLNSFIWMGLFWSVLNLLPVQPLDGGCIARAFMERVSPRSGITVSLYVSLFLAVMLAVFCAMERNFFMAFFFFLFARNNYAELKS